MATSLLGRIFPSTFALFPLPKDAGPESADNFDKLFSSTITNVYNSLTTLPIVKVPLNLPSGTAKALFSLFGRYQLNQSGGSSTHPALDSFRRLTDKWVFDTYGQDNIIEYGSSLTRMAVDQSMCAAHTCSPNIDGRDRARAVTAAGIAAKNPNHPFQAELVARGNQQWNNPAWMCNNLAHNCVVEGRIGYASFSMQDRTPRYFQQVMDAHNNSTAIVSLQLPVPLLYVDKFYEVDTGARWELDRERDVATCFPGFGDAGYEHKWSTLKTWITGFQNTSLFAEVLYQFGSATVLRISRNGNEAGTQSYPIMIKTMMEKYAYIEADAKGIQPFLTSASHYDRLVSFLSTHFDKFSDDLFKAALERVSVLTPAIVLGDDKYTDRWVLTSDERLSVAFSACVDVQKMMHRTTIAQRRLEVMNDQLATSSRRAEAESEPPYAERLLAWMRGERSITSTRTIGDWVADSLDYRSGRSLVQTTHLEESRIMNNGKAREDALAAAVPPANPPPPAAQQPAGGRYIPRRPAVPVVGNWWPANNEAWLNQLNGLPAPRQAQLIQAFDPVQNHLQAVGNLAGLPLNNLHILQQRAVGNWDWDVDTRIDLLIVGPPGTGKTFQSRRLVPPGTAVVVATNEQQTMWQNQFPGHPVFTLDEAVANINLVRNAPCILIDEVYSFPQGHVHTLCSQHIPVVAIGCPGQKRYNGPLGQRFSHLDIPVDYHVVLNTVQRFGADLTAMVNRHYLPVYNQEFFGLIPPNFAFVSANPGVNNIQRNLVQRPGQHITFHRANTNVFPGTITVDASQGQGFNDLYIHFFRGDEAAYAQNPYALPLAWSRSGLTVTFTIPQGCRRQEPLCQWLIANGIPANALVQRRIGQTQVFGSRYDPVSHGFSSLDNLDSSEPAVPRNALDELIATQQAYMEDMNYDFYDDILEDETPLENVISPALAEALFAVQPEPPQGAEHHRDKTLIRFRKPDPAVRIRVPEWIQAQEQYEPTIYHHIGYPFSNTEILASILAVFDRYTKPQNVSIPNKRAFQLADLMFDRWVKSYIRTDAQVVMPSVDQMFKQWFSNAKALRIHQVAEQLPFIDSGRMLQNEYFLKCQCKAKFKAFGFCAECGQGILATNKLLNATICPLIVAATKECQVRLLPNVVYDSGYTAEELDNAVRASGALYCTEHLSSDLSQQDSSHINVHRYFIAKVMAFLGFNDTIITLYLMSRARRFCKGLTILGLLFEVIERLFSGEPGTAFFNWLMNGGTVACTVDLVTKRPKLIMGKGDDISVSPRPPRLRWAVNMVKETGVKIKLEHFSYLDFANRIWTTSGRSFADPIRMVAKYTMRMTKRKNSFDEWMAFRDQKFVMTPGQFEEVVRNCSEKHGLDYWVCHEITEAAIALHRKECYFGSLRPSKVPVEWMPVVRKIGKYDVVFENLTDNCAPEAIAFIADVDPSLVRSYVNRLRLSRHRSQECIDRNAASPFPRPFFMDDWEIRQACTKFGVRLAGGELSLLQVGGHVVVVRAKVSWRTQRFGLSQSSVFGSAISRFDLFWISAVCICAAYGLRYQQIGVKALRSQIDVWVARIKLIVVLFLTSVSPLAFIILMVPPFLMVWCFQWYRFAFYFWLAVNIGFRLFLLPFQFRALPSNQMKKVRAVRVEHAIYGSTLQTKVHFRMLEKLVFAGTCFALLLSLLGVIDLWALYVDAGGLWYVHLPLAIVWSTAIMVYSWWWWTLPVILIGSIVCWVTRKPLQHFVDAFHSNRICMALWSLVTCRLFLGMMLMTIYGPQNDDWTPPPPPQDDPIATKYDLFVNRCLHNARKPAEKYCRQLLKYCHPDKYQSNPSACHDRL